MTRHDAAQSAPSTAPIVTTNPWAQGPGEQVVLEHVTPLRAAMRRFVRHRPEKLGTDVPDQDSLIQ